MERNQELIETASIIRTVIEMRGKQNPSYKKRISILKDELMEYLKR